MQSLNFKKRQYVGLTVLAHTPQKESDNCQFCIDYSGVIKDTGRKINGNYIHVEIPMGESQATMSKSSERAFTELLYQLSEAGCTRVTETTFNKLDMKYLKGSYPKLFTLFS